MSPEDAILSLVTARGPEKSICPSEAARLIDPVGWHRYLSAVRRAAIVMARDGRLAILRKGKPLDDLDQVRGVIRLALPRPAGTGESNPG